MHWLNRLAHIVVAVCTAWCLVPTVASAATITLGPSSASDYGDVFLTVGTLTGRYQQVYSGDAFGATGPVSLTEMRFRPRMGNAFSIELSDVAISLSTTSAGPGRLDGTFDDNVGADATPVYSGELALISAGTSGAPAADFDVVISFQTPFDYDPSAGNLLLDWQSLGDAGEGVGFVNFDALYTASEDPFSGMLAPSAASFAGGSLPGGLITQFNATASLGGEAIPEPTGLLLFACGMVLVMAPRQRAY
jgi:hypothetical protein